LVGEGDKRGRHQVEQPVFKVAACYEVFTNLA
jgi:hypothetical protein